MGWVSTICQPLYMHAFFWSLKQLYLLGNIILNLLFLLDFRYKWFDLVNSLILNMILSAVNELSFAYLFVFIISEMLMSNETRTTMVMYISYVTFCLPLLWFLQSDRTFILNLKLKQNLNLFNKWFWNNCVYKCIHKHKHTKKLRSLLIPYRKIN